MKSLHLPLHQPAFDSPVFFLLFAGVALVVSTVVVYLYAAMM